VLVVGYLITRLRQLGWRQYTALFAAAVLRGSYHLYQGFGGFVGNLVMGLVFGFYWQRTKRLWPLVIAHTILDVVAFIGYTMLRGKVSWLP
jgi:membrane protease YdiL (CAAX protease family)